MPYIYIRANIMIIKLTLFVQVPFC